MTTTPDAAVAPAPAPGWRIATLRGVPVYLGRSWPIVALVIVATFGPSITRALPGLGAGAYLVAVAYALLLLGSVLAHEAGHALVAQRFGHRVDAIVADLWGGHTTYQAHTNTPGRSALVAVAGPLANAVLAVVAYLAWPHVTHDVTALLVGALYYSNAFVAVFNLLPGLPLDGGFLVDSLVWKATGSRTTGQIVAGWTGRVVTLGVVAWFVVLPLLRGETPDLFSIMWMALIASFLWQGATAAIAGARAQRAINTVDPRTLVRPTHLVPATATLAQVAADGIPAGTVAITTDPAGRPVGVFGDAVSQVPSHLWATTPVSAVTVALPAAAVVDWRDDLTTTDLLTAMARADIGACLVHDVPTGTYGFVAGQDVEQALGA